MPWLCPQLLSTSPSRCRGFPTDQRDSLVLLRQGDRCPCCAGRASSTVAVVEETVALPQLQLLRNSPDVVSIPSWCRGSFHGLADHRNSAVSLRQGDRRPCCTGGVSSTGAVVEETVVLPRVHLLGNSWRVAHRLRDELKEPFFGVLHTGAGPRVVSTGTRHP